jgi:nicotinate phosphoribosyltransferase
VRRILDQGGLADVSIFASGGLEEDMLQRYVTDGVPIDGYGVGTSLTTSQDAPALDCAYKIQEYAGVPKRKRSEGKATWPGRKQVWRRYDGGGPMVGDVLSLEDDAQEGQTLIRPVMRNGRRIGALPTLEEARALCAAELARLPVHLRRLARDPPYRVEVSDALRTLADEVDRSG